MWIFYSLLTAFTLATSDALTKRVLASHNEYFVAWIRLLFTLPVLVPFLFLIDIPALDRTFWIVTFSALPLEIAAMILYTKALKVSPISVTMPFLALTPLFLIIMAYVIVGERVSMYGAAGIVLMALGSYTLNLHKMNHALLEPVRAIFRERGSVMIVFVAFIFSITASLGKVAIEHSSPIFFGSFYFVLLTALFTPIALVKNRGALNVSKKDILPLSAIGITFALMIIFHMLAMSLTNVAYMISVKRTSLLFSILYGRLLFREERIAERMVGATIMLIGFVCIVFSNQ